MKNFFIEVLLLKIYFYGLMSYLFKELFLVKVVKYIICFIYI